METNKIYRNLATGVIALSLVFTACKKGDTGPQGPAGPQGVAGTNGTNGTNGTANISSFTATTTNTSWTLSGTEYDATIAVSGIDASVVSNGMVMVYMGNTAQTEWSALPFSYQSVEFNYSYSLGQVMLQVTLGNGATPGNPGGIPFKIVVIPPSMVKQQVNHYNYNEVKTAYNL